MSSQNKAKLLLITFVSFVFGVATIAIVYFVTTSRAPTAPEGKPKAAGGLCYLEFFFPSPTPSPTIGPSLTPTQTLTPTLTPTITPSPIPHTCGYTPCNATNNPCIPTPGMSCIETSNGNYCGLDIYQSACIANPSYSTCCLPPSTATPTATLTSTPTSTPTPTATPPHAPTTTPSPTPTPIYVCQSVCSSSSNCQPANLSCMDISGTNRCVNPSCPYDADCVCNAPTDTPYPTNTPIQYIAQVQPTATPTYVVLNEAGISFPTWTAGAAGAFLLLLGALFFAL